MKIANKKMGWGQYFSPTPKNIQKLADALVGFSLFMTGYATVMESKTLAIIFIVIGGIGAFGQKLVGE